MLTGFVSPFIYMVLSQFLSALWPMLYAALVGIAMWVAGYLLAKYWDPEFFTVLLKKRVRFTQTRGPGKYKGNRYWG